MPVLRTKDLTVDLITPVVMSAPMPHQFEAGNKHMLKHQHRREVQPAEYIVERSSPNPDEICADLGAGTGYVSIPLARQVKAVIALDSQVEMLDSLMESLEPGQGTNIWPVIGMLPELPFADGSVDRIFIINVLHEFEDKQRLVQELGRVLKEGGRVSLVEFQKKENTFGPPMSLRIPIEDVEGIFSGFTSVESWSFDEFYQFELTRD